MGIVGLLDYLMARRRTVARIVLVLMALLVLADILLPSHYDRFFWETLGGFGAFYGFVSSVLLIAVAKGIGLLLLYRREDYYADLDGADDEPAEGLEAGPAGAAPRKAERLHGVAHDEHGRGSGEANRQPGPSRPGGDDA